MERHKRERRSQRFLGTAAGVALMVLVAAFIAPQWWKPMSRRDRSSSPRAEAVDAGSNRYKMASFSSRAANSANPRAGGALLEPVGKNSEVQVIPERVQTWLREKLTPSSFAAGIALMKEHSLPEQARVLIMDKLHSWRRYLSSDSLKLLLAETESIARDSTQARELRSRAVNGVATILVVLQEQNLFSQAEVKTYNSFLTELSQATEADPLVRGRAIRALGILKVDNAGTTLRELLAVPENMNNQELARNACLALAQVEGVTAAAPIRRVLETTGDEAVFGTAAFALGQMQTPEAMAALVLNEARFPSSGSADAALVNMEDLILRVLQEPEHQNITSAIDATRHLWKDGQRDRYTPLLRSLVEHSALTAQQAAVVRLIEDSRSLPLEQEQETLAMILPPILKNPQLADYAQQIQNRLNAKPLVPNAAAIPTVGRPR